MLFLAARSSCGARSQPDAGVPLHRLIGTIDSVGRIPSSQFVFLASDRVRRREPVPSRYEWLDAWKGPDGESN